MGGAAILLSSACRQALPVATDVEVMLGRPHGIDQSEQYFLQTAVCWWRVFCLVKAKADERGEHLQWSAMNAGNININMKFLEASRWCQNSAKTREHVHQVIRKLRKMSTLETEIRVLGDDRQEERMGGREGRGRVE